MKKILFVNQDTTPYVEESVLAKLGMMIPNKLQEAGNELRIIMPLYGLINERRGQLHEVIRLSGLNINISEIDHPVIIKVASIPQTKLQAYFIDNEEFFSRKAQTTDADGKPFADNGERAVFFARGVIETIKKQRWTPDVVVCNGWMAALLPLYVKEAYKDEPAIADAKIITAVFDEAPEQTIKDISKNSLLFNSVSEEFLSAYGDSLSGMDLAKMAIDHSDGIIAAVPNSNEAIMDYARQSNKKVLEYPGDDFVAAYTGFFDSL